MSETELESYIEKVRAARACLLEKALQVKALQEKFESENKQILGELSEAEQDLVLVEAELRDRILKAHRATGQKKFCGGKLSVRIVKSMQYDEAEALTWAIESGAENCLTLQKTNFKKAAEGLALPFVQISENPQATIAKEL